VASGTLSGFSYVDVKYSGTNSTGSTIQFALNFESFNQINAVTGQVWAQSAYIALVGGSVTGLTSLGLDIVERAAAGTFLTSSGTSLLSGLTGNLQRISATRTLTDATTERISSRIVSNIANGNSIDITLRIAAPQLEQGAFATSYIPTTTVAVPRQADSAIVNPISSFYNQAEGTLFAEASSFSSAANASSVALTAGGSADERIQMRVRGSAVSIVAAAATSFVSSSADPAANVANKRAAAAKLNDFAVSTNGGAAETDTAGDMPSVTHLVAGALSTGLTQPLNGHIRKLAYWPRRLSNALLETLTT
jgi:hypothetical protein